MGRRPGRRSGPRNRLDCRSAPVLSRYTALGLPRLTGACPESRRPVLRRSAPAGWRAGIVRACSRGRLPDRPAPSHRGCHGGGNRARVGHHQGGGPARHRGERRCAKASPPPCRPPENGFFLAAAPASAALLDPSPDRAQADPGSPAQLPHRRGYTAGYITSPRQVHDRPPATRSGGSACSPPTRPRPPPSPRRKPPGCAATTASTAPAWRSGMCTRTWKPTTPAGLPARWPPPPPAPRR